MRRNSPCWNGIAPARTWTSLIEETTAYLRAVLPPVVPCRGVTTDLSRVERLTVAEAFARYAGADVLATAEDAAALAAAAGTRLREDENWEDLFFRLLLERIEPQLGRAHPTFLTHWPAAQAALARRDPADPRVAERFELFVCGIELANAFVELTDAAEQRARFEADRAGATRCPARTGRSMRIFSQPCLRHAAIRRHRARFRPARDDRLGRRQHRSGAVAWLTIPKPFRAHDLRSAKRRLPMFPVADDFAAIAMRLKEIPGRSMARSADRNRAAARA